MLKDLVVNGLVKPLGNLHTPSHRPNVFLLATPRGGSTWLMEMIWSQPGFRSCNEPLDLRNPLVRKHLGVSRWEDLYSEGSNRLLERYIERLASGRLYIVDPLPLRGRYHRCRTDRMVFKLLHGAEDRVGHLAERCNGKVVLLLRHPIPVSLSRKSLPRLRAFFESDYRRHFSDRQLRAARKVVEEGSQLEQAVVDWCFQNAVPLREPGRDWTVVSYEQLVLEPETVISQLARRLELPDPKRMLAQVTRASAVTSQSDEEARRLLYGDETNDGRAKLITRWRKRVEPRKERRLMALLDLFEIDAYAAGDLLPASRYWLPGPPEANTKTSRAGPRAAA